MKHATTKRAKALVAELVANVDYEAFGARQRATWDAIHAAGPAIAEQVLRALRERLPPAHTSDQGRA